MISVRVPAIQPATASTVAAAITRPGIAIESAEGARAEAGEPRPRSEAEPRASDAGEPGSRRGDRAARPGRHPRDPPVIERIARPAVSARTNAITIPATSRTPNERTIGIGESRSTRKPAAVARQAVGDHRARRGRRLGRGPRRRGAAAARLVEPRLELDRVVHREPDQHRQAGDRRHRQRPAEQRQRAERDRAGDQRRSASGSSRSGGAKTSARTSAITTRAAISSTTISLLSSSVRPSTTTGTPLTRYEPLRRRNASSVDRGADQVDRLGALGLAQVGPQPDRDQRRLVRREQVGELRLRRPVGEARVEDDRADEGRVVSDGSPVCP